MLSRIFWLGLASAGLTTFTAFGNLEPLHPKFEGVYEVSVRCATDPCGLRFKIDRLILMDEGKGVIRLNLIHASTLIPVYLLLANRVDKAGAHLEADAFLTNHRAVEWVGDIDPRSGTLSGRIRDGGLTSELVVTGRLLASPDSQYALQPVPVQLSPLDIKGEYKVERSFDEGLSLRAPLGGTPPLVGTWKLWGTRIDFEDSELLPNYGVLVLYSRGLFSCLKWTVSLRRNAAGEVEGKVFAFSSQNGKYYRTTFKR